MNYKAHYERLIERARARMLTGYTERHHIVPRCMGGPDRVDNIVRLTPEEHYVAHLLLVKMHPKNHRLLWSAVAMTNRTKNMPRKNKLHGWLRRRFAKAISERSRGRKMSDEARAKMSAAKRGKKRGPHSDETKRKMSLASRGKPKSKQHRAALARARSGKKRGPHSEEWRKNQSKGIKAAFANRDFQERKTSEYRARQSARMKEIWAERRKPKEQ